MRGKGAIVLLTLLGVGWLGYRYLPPNYNPFVPLQLSDPPGRITQFKLRRLTPEACTRLLEEANRQQLISSQPMTDTQGNCPLENVVRVRSFGSVGLSSSFLASCPLALSSALFVEQQARPLAVANVGSALRQIDHLGSYACRNIYNRPDTRRSEHASAEALDIAAFRFENGRRVSVQNGWRQPDTRPFLRALLDSACQYYGNGLGPEYNAAHADHFHLGMRGYGLCR